MSVFTITIEQRRAQTDENMTCSFSRSNAGPTGPSSTRWCNRSRDTAWMCQEHYDQVAKTTHSQEWVIGGQRARDKTLDKENRGP